MCDCKVYDQNEAKYRERDMVLRQLLYFILLRVLSFFYMLIPIIYVVVLSSDFLNVWTNVGYPVFQKKMVTLVGGRQQFFK